MNATMKIGLSVLVTALVVGFGTYFAVSKKIVDQPTATQKTATVKPLSVDEQLRKVLSIDSVTMNKMLLEDILKPIFGNAALIGVSETNNCAAFEEGCGRQLTETELNNAGVQDPLFVYDVKRVIKPEDMQKLKDQLNKSQYPVQESSSASILAHGAGGDNTFLSITADVNDTGRFQVRVLVY